VFEGDVLSNVRGLVAAGLGVAIVPAPRAGSPVAAPGPVVYRPILDAGAERGIYLTWPADKPLLPAPELFRRHVIDIVAAGRIRPVIG
jgi:DNA-binding transcriptional LysR family regulator